MNILKVLTPNRIIGNFGERAAVKFLKRNGYRVLKVNYISDGSEIDIIAKKNKVLAFIEVKSRNIKSVDAMGLRPASAVTPEKQRHIISAARHYLSRNPHEGRMRFDIIEVYLEKVGVRSKVKEIKHLESCFNLNTAYDAKYYYKRKKEGSNL